MENCMCAFTFCNVKAADNFKWHTCSSVLCTSLKIALNTALCRTHTLPGCVTACFACQATEFNSSPARQTESECRWSADRSACQLRVATLRRRCRFTSSLSPRLAAHTATLPKRQTASSLVLPLSTISLLSTVDPWSTSRPKGRSYSDKWPQCAHALVFETN